jgi:peptidoglycan hydrolase-like protein with peptidoglycan-binding domain
VPASPEALLGRDTVTSLQQALAGRGLLGEHRQGELDPPTQAAVRRFQEQQGLAATGVPDKETLRKLGVSAEEAYGPSRGGKG